MADSLIQSKIQNLKSKISNSLTPPKRLGASLALSMLLLPAVCLGQGLKASALLQPATTTWPTYNGDYSGRRFSTLDQINSANVRDLTLAWLLETQTQGIKSTPLEVNGILYFSVPDYVWAVDARTGHKIWEYHRPSEGDHIGNRGVGMYGNWLYFTTPDAHLVCLNAKDGSVRWIIQLADPNLGYFATMAPLIVRDHIIVGVSGDVTDIPGFLDSVDPATGKLQWRWYTEPKPGQPGSDTWPRNSDAIRHGGGMTWMTGTYDPTLNLLYWGTGNPNPVLAGAPRPGDNLFTCSIVALNPDTGKLVWYFQPSPHDVHDWDAVETPVIFNAPFDGRPRKLLAQASRNGFFFVLDRADGKHLVTAPFIHETWASGIDSRGRPIAIPAAAPRPDGALVEPASDGSTNWLAPSFDPQTRLFYVVAHRVFSVFYLTAQGKAEGWAGTDKGLWADSAIRAIDYRTGKIVWDHEIGRGEGSGGILTTAGHLLFTADDSGNLMALDPATGKTLWHVYLGGRMESDPETFELDGRQYLVVSAQNLLFAFALPKSSG
ncbi:MAG TPA: acido-empty-quinoprotein group A [Terriglobia bacterium]|nr:acido-empty-quinoprotein group A [Terriglobia bacterium]